MDKKKKQLQTLKEVLSYIKKYRIYMLLSVILAAASALLTLYVPILTGRAIDFIIEVGRVDCYGIKNILIEAGIIILITAVLQWIMNVCNNKITYHVVHDIREEAFEKIEILPLKYIDGKSHGEIVSRVIADVDQFSEGLLMGFTQFFTGITTILGTLFFMFRLNVGITILVVCLTPISLFVASFIAKRTFSMFKLQSETRGEQTGLIEEMIGNQKIVKAFGLKGRRR